MGLHYSFLKTELGLYAMTSTHEKCTRPRKIMTVMKSNVEMAGENVIIKVNWGINVAIVAIFSTKTRWWSLMQVNHHLSRFITFNNDKIFLRYTYK